MFQFTIDLVTADIDHDGDLDIVCYQANISDSDRAYLDVLRNDGNGHFVRIQSFEAGLPEDSFEAANTDLATGDFNKDGRPDFVIVGDTRPVRIIMNNGSGTLIPGTVLFGVFASSAGAVECADFDGDGDGDLLISQPTRIGINNGNLSFTFTQILPFTGSIASANILDLNNDSKPDALAYSARFINNGAGTFSQVPGSFNTPMRNAAIADFTGDGRADIASPSSFSSQVIILRNNADSTFTELGRVNVAMDPRYVCAGDFDRDGIADLLVTHGCESSQTCGDAQRVSLIRGLGSGAFTAPIVSNAPSTRPAALADLNGDGRADLVLAAGDFTGSVSDIQIHLNRTPVSCQADITNNQFVDDSDFVLFAQSYDMLLCSDASMPMGCLADLNGDDVVDDSDFALFAVAYDQLTCP